MFKKDFLDSIEKSLQAELLDCGVTEVELGHSTEWRRVPGIVTACLDYTAMIKFKGRKPIPIGPHETLCIPTDIPHTLDVDTGSGGISRWGHYSYRILGGLDICSLIALPPVIKGQASKRIGKINGRLSDLTEADLTTVAERKRLLFDLLNCLASVARPKPFAPGTIQAVSRLAPALEYISANLDEHFGSEELAELCGLSRSRFDTLFREGVGLPPRRHIQTLRLQRARHLLSSTSDTVDQIAEACGFPDQFHFSRIFRKHCGISPTGYRGQTKSAGM